MSAAKATFPEVDETATAAVEAPGQAPKVLYDFNALPDPVKRMLEQIAAAAESGEIENMRPVFELNELKPMVAAAYVDDPIAFWKKDSADGTGRDVLAAMLNVMPSGFVRVGQGQDEMYVWPYFAETDLAKLTPAQEVELYRIVAAVARRADEEGRQIQLLPARHLAERRLALFHSVAFTQCRASPKRTGRPRAGQARPPTWQAARAPECRPASLARCVPAKGVQPHLLPIQSSSITRSALRSTMVRSAS